MEFKYFNRNSFAHIHAHKDVIAGHVDETPLTLVVVGTKSDIATPNAVENTSLFAQDLGCQFYATSAEKGGMGLLFEFVFDKIFCIAICVKS